MPHKKYKGPGAVNPYKRSDSPIKKILILPQKKQYYKEVFKLTFWKVSLKGRVFTFIGVPPMAVAVVAVAVITGGNGGDYSGGCGGGGGNGPREGLRRKP